MTRKKIRKKFQMWLALAAVFFVLMILLSQLKDGRWDDICLGAAFVCVVMAISVVFCHSKCRVCAHPLDLYTITHGGYCRFCGAPVEDEEEKKC